MLEFRAALSSRIQPHRQLFLAHPAEAVARFLQLNSTAGPRCIAHAGGRIDKTPGILGRQNRARQLKQFAIR
jgi:hypothetical protein